MLLFAQYEPAITSIIVKDLEDSVQPIDCITEDKFRFVVVAAALDYLAQELTHIIEQFLQVLGVVDRLNLLQYPAHEAVTMNEFIC